METEAFENWLIEEMRFSPNTVKATMRKMQYLQKHCNVDSRDSIQAFIRKVWSEKGNKTANGYIKIANRYLKYTRKKELKYFKEYGAEFTIQYCTPEQKQMLLDAATRKGKRERAMMYLLFGTGVRLEEAVNLKLENIREDTIIVTGKGQKSREIYLPPESKESILAYIAVRDPTDREYLFTTQKRHMSYDFFRKKMQDCADIAGVKFHPHMARHTYAMELLEGGMDIIYVSKLLGHEDLETTAKYTHPSQLTAIEKARRIDLFATRRKGSPGRGGVQNSTELEGMDRWGTASPIHDVLEPLFLLAFRDTIEPAGIEVSVPWI